MSIQHVLKKYEEDANLKEEDLYVIVKLNLRKLNKSCRRDMVIDNSFVSSMKELTKFLMNSYGAIKGICHADQLILVLDNSRQLPFGRSIVKISTNIAVTASLHMSTLLPSSRPSQVRSVIGYSKVAFDCISFSIPSLSIVETYIQWKERDCYCYILDIMCKIYLKEDCSTIKDKEKSLYELADIDISNVKYRKFLTGAKFNRVKKLTIVDEKLDPKHQAVTSGSVKFERTCIEEE
jgi:tRNA(His) 5'-end guanylyltransferase